MPEAPCSATANSASSDACTPSPDVCGLTAGAQVAALLPVAQFPHVWLCGARAAGMVVSAADGELGVFRGGAAQQRYHFHLAWLNRSPGAVASVLRVVAEA